jgi:excisionase family DNA binding protein
VEHDEVEFLNVRETAQRLGVHENTVRNWVRAGILQSARIPGSQFHRFDARDVERLAQQRGATVSSIEPERRTIGPELVDGTQLSQ